MANVIVALRLPSLTTPIIGASGAVAGVIGTLQAVEVLKLITGTGDLLIGKILLYDALSVRFQTMNYKRRS